MARWDAFTSAERAAIAIGLRMLASRQDGTMHAATARDLLTAEFGDAAAQAVIVERGTGRHIRAYLINGGTPDERVSLRPPEGERGVSVQPLGVVSWLSDEALARMRAAAGPAVAPLAKPPADNVPASWREFVQRVSEQTPEKPDYWSSCGQCQRNSEAAQELLDEAAGQEGGAA